MRKVLVALAFSVLAFSLGWGDTSGPRAGLNIVSGANVSDTVLSIFKPPLVVQLLDGNLQPMSGQTVYFNTNAFVLVAPLGDPGFVIDRLPVTTDAGGRAAVLVEAKYGVGAGKVVIVGPSGESVEAHYTVLAGAAAHVKADPSDTALYVAGAVTYRPYVTDAYGNRRTDAPVYQYRALNASLTVNAQGKATGAGIGRGSIVISAIGFADTVLVSVVPAGRIATQYTGRGDFGGPIIVTNLDGSSFDSIPRSDPGGRSLDWSSVTHAFVFTRICTVECLLSMDTLGNIRSIVTNPLMQSEYYPRYAHDGSYIYFTGNDSVSTCYGVWRMRPDGTGLQQIVADTLDCGRLAYTTG